GAIVPGSTFRYGSHFWRVTRRPRLSSRQPMDPAATPLPREDTTPPVTKIYFGPIRLVPAASSKYGIRNCLNPPERCWRTTHSTGGGTSLSTCSREAPEVQPNARPLPIARSLQNWKCRRLRETI